MRLQSFRCSDFKKRDWLLVDFSEVLELNEIDSPFTRFTFGDKGLRPRQLAGNLSLRKAGVFSGLNQELKERPVLLDVFATLQNLTSRLP